MTSPPDKLFQDGLGQYQKKAPPSAWNRIENNLDQKKNHFPWMKIAAGFILLIAASFMIWKQDQAATEVSQETSVGSELLAITSKQLADDNRESSVVSREEKVEDNLSQIIESNPVDATVTSSPQSKVSRLKSPVSNAQAINIKDKENTPSIEQIEIMTEQAPIAQVEAGSEISSHEIVAESKRTHFTYSVDEVNAKFTKQDPAPDATSEKKNTSGLQKVIDRAIDLTREESVLADLREKKNELLSFTILSEKRETNK